MKPKRQINKISDKLTKVGDSFTVNMYDNGFLFEIDGTSKEDGDSYTSAKIMVSSVEQLIELVKEAVDMPLQD